MNLGCNLALSLKIYDYMVTAVCRHCCVVVCVLSWGCPTSNATSSSESGVMAFVLANRSLRQFA